MKTLHFMCMVACAYCWLPAKAVTCNATFTTQPTSSTAFHFEANQQFQNGYTYYHTWYTGSVFFSYSPIGDYDFNGPGNYQVYHVVSIQDSTATVVCSDTAFSVVQVANTTSCFPYFTTFSQSPADLQINFTNTLANYTGVTVMWTFGDSTSEVGIPAPTHFYAAYGLYNACIYLTDTLRQCSDSLCKVVVVDSNIVTCSLGASFEWNQVANNLPDVLFDDQTYGPHQTTWWDFGDGTTSDTTTVLHHYSAFGIYPVCFTVVDSISGCQDMQCGILQIDSCSPAVADFTYSTPASLPFTYSFYTSNALQHSNPVSWQWTFGDGAADSATINAHHSYGHKGIYNCCFTVDVPGCNTVTKCDSIDVHCTVSAAFHTIQIASNTPAYIIDQISPLTHLKYEWSFGDGAAANAPNPIHAYPASANYSTCFILTDTLYQCTDTVCNNITAKQWNDTICGHAFVDLNLNGLQDTLEPPLAAATIVCNTGAQLLFTTDAAGNYSGVVPDNTPLLITLGYNAAQVFTLPFGGLSYYFNIPTQNTKQCGFDFGIYTNCATVSGTLYADYNQNNVFDNGEDGIPNELIDAGGQYALTGSNGAYQMVLPVGSYTLKKMPGGSYGTFAANPQQTPVNVVTAGALYSGNDFGLGISSGYSDMAVDLIPTTPVSPASQPRYQLVVSNLSPASPAMFFSNITSDNNLLFNTSYPHYSNVPQSHYTSWVGSLGAFQKSITPVGYFASPSVVLNQNIFSSASIAPNGPDANPLNDNSYIHQVVVAPFDPNNKLCAEMGQGEKGFISNSQSLKYVVNFQNTGTYYAVNVIVKDVLSEHLDFKTFRFIASSHPCDVRLEGDTLYFRFSKIMLPDSNTNEPESHGWLAYSIEPKQNLPFMTEINNTAAIYFDQNEPVLTNTTLHTIKGPEDVSDVSDDGIIRISPNPFNEQTAVSFNGTVKEDCRFAIMDLPGRIVAEGSIKADETLQLSRGRLTTGTYIISIYRVDNILARAKIMVR